MRPEKAIALVMLFGFNSVLLGQSHPDPQWTQTCAATNAAAAELPIPTGSIPQNKLASCDSSDLYYGITQKPDYAAAFECAAYERAHPDIHNGDMFRGPGVLTMLYANGQGVARNYDTAIRFACEEKWASEIEMALRVGHLEYLRKTNDAGARFDLCDDITSGLSMGACTSIRTRRADTERDRELATIADALPANAKTVFPGLKAAEAAFEQARVDGEIDLSGTARGMFALNEQKKLRDQFLINLQRFAVADAPQATAADLNRLNRTLNSTYQDIQTAPASAWRYYGTVKPEGIRDAQDKWVALADAWVEFAREAYPKVDANTVRAELIRLRLHQLRSLEPKQ